MPHTVVPHTLGAEGTSDAGILRAVSIPNVGDPSELIRFAQDVEDAGWDGPRHFDAHAYRTEDEEGVWDFALGCMRTYNILREKGRPACPR